MKHKSYNRGDQIIPHCHSKNKSMTLVDEWEGVTCPHCLKHKPELEEGSIDYDRFMRDNELTMQAVRVHSNPSMSDSDWHAVHFSIVLQTPHGALNTFFSMGIGNIASWMARAGLRFPKDRHTPLFSKRLFLAKNPSGGYIGDILYSRLLQADNLLPSGEAMLESVVSTAVKKGFKPQMEDVLDCLRSDSQGVECSNFEEWCSDYGYSDDSIKAKGIYDACIRIEKDLKALFSPESLKNLYEDVERL